MSEPTPWFRAKTIGYGAGLPIAWQGWAAIGAFALAVVCTMLGSDLFLDGWVRFAAKAVGIVLSIAIFGAIVKRRTEGGWRWRMGNE